MTAKQKAKDLVELQIIPALPQGDAFINLETAKKVAYIIVDEILKREMQWIEKLSKDFPDKWQLSDYDKSISIYDELKNEIEIL